MSILKELSHLVSAGVISEETAEAIRKHYETQSSPSTNRLFVVFGILGSILVGLGIILIIAHNWDELSRFTKTCFAFLPLVIGHFLCGYTLFKKMGSTAWRESTSAFLFFAVGASISLVSQIYNIPGDLSAFLLTWMFLCLPIVYVMRSSATSLLVLVGITYYACEASYWSYPSTHSYSYWLLLLGVLPHYYLLYRKQPTGNFMTLHGWAIPLSLTIVLGTLSDGMESLMFIAYLVLFSIFYIISKLDFFQERQVSVRGYNIIGFVGAVFVLMLLTFTWYWEDLIRKGPSMDDLIVAKEFWILGILFLVATILFYLRQKQNSWKSILPLEPMYLLVILTFFIGLYSSISVILINIFVLGLGVLTIRDGAVRNHLGILNLGLVIITILIACRFFDTDLSFVARGLLFVSVGAGFFMANYLMLKKRKQDEV
ncbi:MAG: DUF2157 domain-containing protein [Bacteroidota bacterium]